MRRGLLYVRLAPIATKLCVAEKFRDVPASDKLCSEHEGAWSCRGSAGYRAEFADEGNVAAFSIRLSGRAGKSTFAGRSKVFGDAVEWVLDGDGPKAAVLRIWRAEMPAEGPER